MIPARLEELVIKHKQEGHLPFFVNCTTGFLSILCFKEKIHMSGGNFSSTLSSKVTIKLTPKGQVLKRLTKPTIMLRTIFRRSC
jgi:hypothetical protein